MRVLLAYDGSVGAEAARELVAHLRLPRGVELCVVAAVEHATELFGHADQPAMPPGAHDAERELMAHVEMQLSTVAGSLRTPDRSCSTRILRGRPGTALVDEARRIDADLVVVGSRGHGPLQSILLGSVSAEVVDHAPCPVLVARRPRAHRLLLGVDGSRSAQRAVDVLAAWELLHPVPTLVVGVVEPMATWPMALGGAFAPTVVEVGSGAIEERQTRLEAAIDEAVATLRRAGMLAEGELREGDAAEQLVVAAAQHGADLVVVGTRGLGALGRLLLGSVARNVLLHTDASVLVVRPVRQRAEAREPVRKLAAV
jgi:nucleotide-binding universal stress UspA family protein